MLRMRDPDRLPLACHPRVHTRDIDEAALLHGHAYTPVRLAQPPRSAPFDWTGNYLNLGLATLAAHRFEGGMQLTREDVKHSFCLAIPIGTAGGEGTQAGISVPLARERSGWLTAPEHKMGLRVADGYEGINLILARADVEEALGALLGQPIGTPLQFVPQFAIDAPGSASLLRLIRYVLTEADEVDSALSSPLIAARLGESLTLQLLAVQPHNYSDRLRAPAPPAEPRYVRQVAAYLESNLASPIRMAELSTLTGVSLRAIQLGFQKHRGCTPVAFLREQRLARARTMLRAGHALTVTQVAAACGFEHFGRFSIQYRAAYGESPSQTRGATRGGGGAHHAAPNTLD
jgi:AraC-like DNA-binding protein